MKTKFRFVLFLTIVGFSPVAAQKRAGIVSITLDHNRIIIPVNVNLPGGTTKHVNAWVDNGSPVMSITEGLANEIKSKKAAGNSKAALNTLFSIKIAGMTMSLANLDTPIEIEKAPTVGSGVDAQINLPSSVLRNYDIVIDYPAKKLTIAPPGTIHFRGLAVKGFFNPQNHLIQLPANVDGQDFNLALDAGTPVSYISGDLILKWHKEQPSWPFMTGAIGIANFWGMDDEPAWHLLRIPKMAFGGIAFPGLVAVSFPSGRLDYFQKRAGIPTAGLFGAASMLNYRIGIDYVHGTVYFQKATKPVKANMDVVGLTLRPGNDGRYTILGVADYGGKPAVPGVLKGDVLLAVNNKKVTGLTMGKVWALLHGKPGAVYKLSIGRGGKTAVVEASVYRFLAGIAR